MSAAAKIIAASALVLIVALGLFAWMSRASSPRPAGGAAAEGGSIAGAAATGGATPAAGVTANGASANGAPEGGAAGEAKLPPGTTIGPNGVVFHNPAITGKPPVAAQKLNVPKPVIPRATKPNPEAVRAVRNKLHPAP